MDQVTLAGETGRISLAIDYVQAGAGDCRATVSIGVRGLQAEGTVWFAPASQFLAELDGLVERYEAAGGSA